MFLQVPLFTYSGIDMISGTPVLDIKPYIPYCDTPTTSAVPATQRCDDRLAGSGNSTPECSGTSDQGLTLDHSCVSDHRHTVDNSTSDPSLYSRL